MTEDFMGSLWSVLTIVGPILLLGIIVWAWARNRNAPKGNIDKAERGARELREEIHEDNVEPPRSVAARQSSNTARGEIVSGGAQRIGQACRCSF